MVDPSNWVLNIYQKKPVLTIGSLDSIFPLNYNARHFQVPSLMRLFYRIGTASLVAVAAARFEFDGIFTI